jgi:hypothetical protein
VSHSPDADDFAVVDVVRIACSIGRRRRRHALSRPNQRLTLEADANAAASAHLRERYPHAVDELLAGSDHYLADATKSPGDPKTLVARTVDYLWQFREVCDDPSNLESDLTFAGSLDNRVPGAGAADRWRRFQELRSGS